jgi:hypothetical protein
MIPPIIVIGCVVAILLLISAITVGVRNAIVFRIRNQALDAIYAENVRRIYKLSNEEGTDQAFIDLQLANTQRYEVLDSPSYTKMVFMLNKWSFEDFYPDFAERITK